MLDILYSYPKIHSRDPNARSLIPNRYDSEVPPTQEP